MEQDKLYDKGGNPIEFDATKQAKRVKLLMVDPTGFMSLFKKGLKVRAGFKVIKGVPNDAKLLYVAYDNMRSAIVMVIESETFDLVGTGQLPPIIPVDIAVGKEPKKQ